MQRRLFFVYGVFCHFLFLVTSTYMVGFVGNLLVPKSIDSEPSSVTTALSLDLALILLFALQHSVMARPWFKQIWTRVVPEPIERSTYVLASCLVLVLLMWQWRALDALVWDVTAPVLRGLLWALFAAGWLLVPAVSFMISHSDLFGIRQVWLHLRGKPYRSLPFRTPMLYTRIRHPLYVGWAIAFLATPTMTVGHLVFALSLIGYILIAVQFEERDLVNQFGTTYREYQQRVPMFFPKLAQGNSPDREEVGTALPVASENLVA